MWLAWVPDRCSRNWRYSPRCRRGARTPRHSGRGRRQNRRERGVDQNAKIDGRERAPSKHLSLHAHYAWHMDRAYRAGRVGDLYLLTAQATRDFEERTAKHRSESFERDADAARRLLERWEGYPADEAAGWMAAPGQSPKSAKAWVRRTRRLHGCDPEDGTPEQLVGKRAAIVTKAKGGQLTQTQIAAELGCRQSYVLKVLAGEA